MQTKKTTKKRTKREPINFNPPEPNISKEDQRKTSKDIKAERQEGLETLYELFVDMKSLMANLLFKILALENYLNIDFDHVTKSYKSLE